MKELIIKFIIDIVIFIVSTTTANQGIRLGTIVDQTSAAIEVNNQVVSSISASRSCGRSGGGALRYTWGDAFADPDCIGPNGEKYPTQMIGSIVRSYKGTLRKGRSMEDPYDVRDKLLDAWRSVNDIEQQRQLRDGRSAPSTTRSKTCPSYVAGPLCKTTYNTTAPLYGVSLTSGESVTIVQKFPDLLQQIIFETCKSSECDMLHGQCVQTYTPYLFLVVPLGPVTLTGQDYVMVESGCVCQPKTYTTSDAT